MIPWEHEQIQKVRIKKIKHLYTCINHPPTGLKLLVFQHLFTSSSHHLRWILHIIMESEEE